MATILPSHGGAGESIGVAAERRHARHWGWRCTVGFLLAMTLGFLGLCLWAFRPGSRTGHDEAANSIFRNDDRPADATPVQSRKEP